MSEQPDRKFCPRCHTGLDYEAQGPCSDCGTVFHRAEGDYVSCLELHDCPVRKQRDEEKLAAWVAASGVRDA
ncbi:hypothetical protein LCGC14_1711390 [marine sediment metagenome]|uniref:Uncharacterized protein n=1 Tax=marine sediment metagenome TaxID=412755 RepID=A0A0F9JVJ3_9ZZZZ